MSASTGKSWKVLNPLEVPGWNDALASHPDSSFFHTANWARVLSETYGYTPQYLLSAGEGLNGLVPFMDIRSSLTGRRGVSLPFTDYSNPILGGDADVTDALHTIIRHAKAAGWKYLEIRNPDPFLDSVPVFATYFGHLLDISGGEESVLAGLRSSTKRNMKKAAREGVSVQECTTEDSVREFFRLHCVTRREHGLPPPPFLFFRKIYEHVIAEGLGFVAFALYEGKPVAGTVCFHFGEKAIYKFGASDKSYQHLRANNVVMWESIRACIRKGCRSFCFGRTAPSNEGLIQFKAGWGAEQQTFRYYRYDLAADGFVAGGTNGEGFYNRIFAAMPVPLCRVVGQILYRHVG